MIFLLFLSCITGGAGCVITTALLPELLRSRGIQCGVFTTLPS